MVFNALEVLMYKFNCLLAMLVKVENLYLNNFFMKTL